MMTIYDFFQEQIVPFFKTDYQNFDSKNVEGYEVFKAKWDKVEREAMVTAEVLKQLQHIQEKFVRSTKYKEEDLSKSQISRWYVNGFTMAYNYCRRYDLDHPHQQTNFTEFAKKLKSSEDLEQGKWNVDKFRKYTINLGRQEGTLFYMVENPQSQNDVAAAPQPTTTNQKTDEKTVIDPGIPASEENSEPVEATVEKPEYKFSEELMEELYHTYNGVIFKDITTLEEFENILSRKPHSERFSECNRKKMQMYKLLMKLCRVLPEDSRNIWLQDIANECGYSVENIQKKFTGSDSSTDKYIGTLDQLDDIFDQYELR